MNTTLSFGLAALLASGAPGMGAVAADFHVAPDGKDPI